MPASGLGNMQYLKHSGSADAHLAGLIFGESIVIAIIGGAAGIAATFPVAKAFGEAMGDYFPVFNVATTTIYMDIAAALLVGLVAAIVPAWRCVHIRIADGLRSIG